MVTILKQLFKFSRPISNNIEQSELVHIITVICARTCKRTIHDQIQIDLAIIV